MLGYTKPNVGVIGPGPVLVALLQGAIPLELALTNGVRIDGDASALTRVLPPAPDSINVPGQYS